MKRNRMEEEIRGIHQPYVIHCGKYIICWLICQENYRINSGSWNLICLATLKASPISAIRNKMEVPP